MLKPVFGKPDKIGYVAIERHSAEMLAGLLTKDGERAGGTWEIQHGS